MGAWGITVRQSDDGLDLLDTIVMEQLRKVEFSAFNVSEAITLLNQKYFMRSLSAGDAASPA